MKNDKYVLLDMTVKENGIVKTIKMFAGSRDLMIKGAVSALLHIDDYENWKEVKQ